MTTPRSISGQALLSGTRPHIRRALGRTIVAIEAEAIAPCLEALREADRVLEEILASAHRRLSGELEQHAQDARRLASPFLAPSFPEGPE